MVRVFLGLIKGAVIGAALGFGATKLGVTTGALAYATYAIVGFVVGLVAGKAVWRQQTLWTPALKGIFGAAISVGLYWVANKFLGGMKLTALTEPLGVGDRPLLQVPLAVAPILAVIYGIFVEVDDGERKPASTPGA